jgi:hypothetical protein
MERCNGGWYFANAVSTWVIFPSKAVAFCGPIQYRLLSPKGSHTMHV